MAKLTILGLAGVDGSAGMGKDTVAAKHLRQYGFYPVALADEIKMRVVARGDCTFEEAFLTKPAHVRQLLQQEGTEKGRKVFGENYWCDQLLPKLQYYNYRWGFSRFVITDVRFPNEVGFVHSCGGYVYGLRAPKRYAANGMTDENRVHTSERALDGQYHLYDAFVDNDPEHEDTVGQQISSLLTAHRLIDPLPQVRMGVSLKDTHLVYYDEPSVTTAGLHPFLIGNNPN